jgi:hypothetical protein
MKQNINKSRIEKRISFLFHNSIFTRFDVQGIEEKYNKEIILQATKRKRNKSYINESSHLVILQPMHCSTCTNKGKRNPLKGLKCRIHLNESKLV